MSGHGPVDFSAAAGGQPAEAPSRGLDGDPVDAVIERALVRLEARRQQVRDPQTGRWALRNGGRLETGLHAESFWRDLEEGRAEIERRVYAQLGLTVEDGPETVLGLCGAYAEARLIRRSEFLQLTRLPDERTVNVKQRRKIRERRRGHLTAWAMAFDRELKAALALGLERRARKVSLAEYLSEAQEMARADAADTSLAAGANDGDEPVRADRLAP